MSGISQEYSISGNDIQVRCEETGVCFLIVDNKLVATEHLLSLFEIELKHYLDNKKGGSDE